jgi:hypothetical protein
MFEQRHPMRSMLVWIVAAMTAIPVFATKDHPSSGGMTKSERAYLLSQLRSSEAGLLKNIKGLTLTQWKYQASPESWSIEECTEHLILAEGLIFTEAQRTLQTPAVTRLPNATLEGDRQLVAELEDRSNKAKAPKAIQPTGIYPTPDSAAQEFKRRRDKTIAYVKATKDPLRIHFGTGLTGAPADVYQFLLEMSAHSARHTAQISEVKAIAAYPPS